MSTLELFDDWQVAEKYGLHSDDDILPDYLLADFERASVHSSRTSREHGRANVTYEVGMHDSRFLAEYTPGEDGSPAPLIVCLPGIGQALDDGSERSLRDHLAATFPQSGVLSVGSNSIGIASSRDTANREQTASDRLDFLLSILPEGKKVAFVGTSMGAQAVHDMLSQNEILGNQKLSVAGVVYFAPALVTPDITRTMEKRFWIGLAVSATREIAKEDTNTKRNTLRNLGKYALQVVANTSSILHQMNEIRRGTAQHEIAAIAACYPVHVISGLDDPLTEGKMRTMWENMEGVTTTWVPNAGHEAVFLTHITRPAIQRALHPMLHTSPFSA